MSMIPGINLINFTKGRWPRKEWEEMGRDLETLAAFGFQRFRIWVHFNYTHTKRDPGKNLRLDPSFVEALRSHAPHWPGEILFEWSWGYYGDRVSPSWLDASLGDHFGDERNTWTMAELWLQDLLDGHFVALAEDWRALIASLGEPRFSFSVGNELDGLLQSTEREGEREALCEALRELDAPFTAGWRNEYSFADSLFEVARTQGPVRFSYYEKNEFHAQQEGEFAESAPIQHKDWGVAEFGITKRDDVDDAIRAMQKRMRLFRAHGAEDVFLWSWGAGDCYEWQVQHEDYLRAFVKACGGR